jgi:hypothetical protein
MLSDTDTSMDGKEESSVVPEETAQGTEDLPTGQATPMDMEAELSDGETDPFDGMDLPDPYGDQPMGPQEESDQEQDDEQTTRSSYQGHGNETTRVWRQGHSVCYKSDRSQARGRTPLPHDYPICRFCTILRGAYLEAEQAYLTPKG